jgi:hypothetical protein
MYGDLILSLSSRELEYEEWEGMGVVEGWYVALGYLGSECMRVHANFRGGLSYRIYMCTLPNVSVRIWDDTLCLFLHF